MGLNVVQLYVQELLDGLVIPLQPAPLQAAITPVSVDDLDSARCYIWGGRMRGRRQSMPRGQGYKERTWSVDTYLISQESANADDLDQLFPLVVDTVLHELETTVLMNVFRTDPTTGIVSQITNVAEEYELEYAPVHTPGDLQLVLFQARLGVTVKEAQQL